MKSESHGYHLYASAQPAAPSGDVSWTELNGFERGPMHMDAMDSTRVFVKDVKRLIIKVLARKVFIFLLLFFFFFGHKP